VAGNALLEAGVLGLSMDLAGWGLARGRKYKTPAAGVRDGRCTASRDKEVRSIELTWNSIKGLVRIKGTMRGATRRRASRHLDPELLRRLAFGIATTRPDEIACDECFEVLGRYVELSAAGQDAGVSMPLVRDHLARCGDCREELEALLGALLAVA
jgi:hypothetical protein